MSYVPMPGSLAERVILFFRRDPEEALSVSDIAIKFQCGRHIVEPGLALAVSAKALERFRSGTLEWQYRAGKNIDSTNAADAAHAAPPRFPAPPPSTRAKRAAPPTIDLAAVGVESDVPVPAVIRKRIDWAVLFERFTAAGMCSSPLPKECKPSLQSQANDWFKAKGWKYAIRVVSDTHLRIWRTE